MALIQLTRGIDEGDYIDNVVAQIKNVPVGESLEMEITCVGGDTFQGDRLHRAVTLHKGHTKAVVIGIAASMGGVLLSAFDEVEIDYYADTMLHKAYIPNVPEEELTDEQRDSLNRFNQRAYSRMLDKGVNKEFLDKVFLSEDRKDHWLTADEAEKLGIGKSVKIERKDSEPFRVAAKLDIEKIKNHYNMNIFKKGKKEGVARVMTMPDERQILFNSVAETPQKGDTIQLIGSNELLEGKLKISNEVELVVNEENQVVDVVEIETPKDEVDVNALMEKIEALENALAAMTEKKKNEEDEEDEKEKEMQDKLDQANKVIEQSNALLEASQKVAAAIKSGFKLPKIEDKSEPIINQLETEEERAAGLREIVNMKQENK